MQGNGEPPDATSRRFAEDMQRVRLCVHREFIRAGLADGEPRGDWSSEEMCVALGPEDGAPRGHRIATVVSALFIVERACQAAGTPRERAIDALKRLRAAIREADQVIWAAEVHTYVMSVSNVGSEGALYEEPEVDSSDLPGMLASLNWVALRRSAKWAGRTVRHLESRRPEALAAEVYASKGAGPFAHFCYELFQPVAQDQTKPALTLLEIAEVTGELPDRSRYSFEENWAAARDEATERIRQRVGRIARAVKRATQR